VNDLVATLRALNQMTTGYLNALGKIQQEVTGEPDRLEAVGAQHGRAAGQMNRTARLMADQHDSLSGNWGGFAGETNQQDLKGQVEKLAVAENGLRRERNRLNESARLLRTTRSTVDGEITEFTKRANEVIGNVGCAPPADLTNALKTAGDAAVQRSLTAQKDAGTALGRLFASGDTLNGLPYDAWRAGKEYDSLVNYIHKEMVDNARSSSVADMKKWNSSIVTAPYANKLWYDQVAPDHPWDHKPKIKELYGMSERPLNEYQGSRDFWSPVPAPGGQPPAGVSYQVWSNIHYGYVGLEAGFSETWLQAGAHGADVVMRQKIDWGDATAIGIGAELRREYAPHELRPEHINAAIMRHYDELVTRGKIRPTPAWER
jgi:uncharacterized protein YukE